MPHASSRCLARSLPLLGRAFAAAGLLALAACSTAPSHPALVRAGAASALPPLVPMRRFVANVDLVDGHSISPDGRSLLWLQAVGADVGLAVRPVPEAAGADAPDAAGTRRFATGTLARAGSGPTYAWLADSHHVAYLKDFTGDENTRIFVLDSDRPGAEPWDVTPGSGIRSTFVARGAPGSGRFFFSNNRRDRSSMDLYEADAATRTVREVARSEADGRVLGWRIGGDHRLAARWRQLGASDPSV
ncbi:MAG: hypothetical protein EOO24_10530, partial [Comamonadaceae bacterium]